MILSGFKLLKQHRSLSKFPDQSLFNQQVTSIMNIKTEYCLFDFSKVLTTVVLLIVAVVVIGYRYRPIDELYLGKIPWVGRRREWFSGIRGNIRALRHMHEMAREGYNIVCICERLSSQTFRLNLEVKLLITTVFETKQSFRGSFLPNWAYSNDPPKKNT